jgi:tetratricopeptide (TPR) repeat protein
VNAFLNDDLLAAADPTRSAAGDISMRKVVDLASARIRGRFADEPVVKAAVQRTLGQTYLGLGLGEQAKPTLLEALALFEKNLGPDDPETLRTASALGSLELYLARYDEAAERLTRTGDAQARRLGEEARDTLVTRGALAQVRYEQGRIEEAGAVAQGVVEAARRGIGEDADSALAAANLVATVALDQGRFDEAEKSFLHLLDVQRKRAGTDDDIGVLSTLSNLGQVYFQQERYADAERVTAEALARARRVLGNEHRETLNYVNNLAMAKRRLNKMDEAGALYREGYETTSRMFGATAGPTLVSMVNLSSFYGRAGMCAEYGSFVEETVAVCRAHSLPDTPNVGLALRNLAQCRSVQGRNAEAEQAYLEAEKQLASVLRATTPCSRSCTAPWPISTPSREGRRKRRGGGRFRSRLLGIPRHHGGGPWIALPSASPSASPCSPRPPRRPSLKRSGCILSSAGGGGFRLGVAVAGDVGVVCAPRRNLGNGNFGECVLYRLIGGTWTTDGVLLPSAPGMFGSSVAMSGDRIVVGAPTYNVLPGHAFVFRRVAPGSWVEEAVLAPWHGNDTPFGSSVAIDGDVIAVGAPGEIDEAGAPTNPGAVYVFRRNGSAWPFEQKLVAPSSSGLDNLGTIGRGGGRRPHRRRPRGLHVLRVWEQPLAAAAVRTSASPVPQVLLLAGPARIRAVRGRPRAWRVPLREEREPFRSRPAPPPDALFGHGRRGRARRHHSGAGAARRQRARRKPSRHGPRVPCGPGRLGGGRDARGQPFRGPELVRCLHRHRRHPPPRRRPHGRRGLRVRGDQRARAPDRPCRTGREPRVHRAGRGHGHAGRLRLERPRLHAGNQRRHRLVRVAGGGHLPGFRRGAADRAASRLPHHYPPRVGRRRLDRRRSRGGPRRRHGPAGAHRLALPGAAVAAEPPAGGRDRDAAGDRCLRTDVDHAAVGDLR